MPGIPPTPCWCTALTPPHHTTVLRPIIDHVDLQASSVSLNPYPTHLTNLHPYSTCLRPCRGGPSTQAPADKDTGKDKKDQDTEQDGGGGAQEDEGAAGEGKGTGKGGGGGGYAGKVRSDLDHRAYMPAAWRVDEYLDGEGEGEGEQDDLASLRQHRFEAAKVRGGGGDEGVSESGVWGFAVVGWEGHGGG